MSKKLDLLKKKIGKKKGSEKLNGKKRRKGGVLNSLNGCLK